MSKRRTFPIHVARPAAPATDYSCGHQHDRSAAINCAQRNAKRTRHTWLIVRILKDASEKQVGKAESTQ